MSDLITSVLNISIIPYKQVDEAYPIKQRHSESEQLEARPKGTVDTLREN